MKRKVTTAIVLYKSQTKKNGKHPAKLRLTFNRKQMYYSIDTKKRVYEFTVDEYKKITGLKPRGEYKEIQLEFSLIEDKAKRIITSIENFSFNQFKTRFGIAGTDQSNIIYFYENRIKEFEKNEQYSSMGLYSSALLNLKKYFGNNKRIDFREITVQELEKYEQWMLNKELSFYSVHNYISSIRVLFREAHSKGCVSKEIYPFGSDGYKIPDGKNVKRALKLSEIEKIYNSKCKKYSVLDEARDYWIFSYLMNGANFNDIARLKNKNIDTEFISFIRNKTKKKCKTTTLIRVPLTQELKKIIIKWGNTDQSPNNYVFPILQEGMTEKEIKKRLDCYLKKINKYINEIAKEININKRITTYTARHSFSTVLKRSGVSTEFIGESLGHTDIRTTKLYLDSFEDDMKKEVAKHLTAFG
jgi:integrase